MAYDVGLNDIPPSLPPNQSTKPQDTIYMIKYNGNVAQATTFIRAEEPFEPGSFYSHPDVYHFAQKGKFIFSTGKPADGGFNEVCAEINEKLHARDMKKGELRVLTGFICRQTLSAASALCLQKALYVSTDEGTTFRQTIFPSEVS